MGIRLKFIPVVVCCSRRLNMRIGRVEGFLAGMMSILRYCWVVYTAIWLLGNRVIGVTGRDIM
jgi:hypothetical protein